MIEVTEITILRGLRGSVPRLLAIADVLINGLLVKGFSVIKDKERELRDVSELTITEPAQKIQTGVFFKHVELKDPKLKRNVHQKIREAFLKRFSSAS